MRTVWTKEGKFTFEYGVPSKIYSNLHREDGPAEINTDSNGNVYYEGWYRNGKLHRDDGPAEIKYSTPHGLIITETWYKNGIIHRDGGPALIVKEKDGTILQEIWYQNGKRHREDGPADTSWTAPGQLNEQSWYFKGLLHRKDGPAFQSYDKHGNKTEDIWAIYGKWHRDDGPALIWYFDDGSVLQQQWFQRGKLHNLDGPAFIEYYSAKASKALEPYKVIYYILGKEMSLGKWIKASKAKTKLISIEELEELKNNPKLYFFNSKDQYAILKDGYTITVCAVDGKVFESKVFESFEEFYSKQIK